MKIALPPLQFRTSPHFDVPSEFSLDEVVHFALFFVTVGGALRNRNGVCRFCAYSVKITLRVAVTVITFSKLRSLNMGTEIDEQVILSISDNVFQHSMPGVCSG